MSSKTESALNDQWYEIENADEVPSPALLIYPDRVEQNLRTMIGWAGAERLRPHVKTHKLPQIVGMKLSLGITKFKTSTIAESEMAAAAGARDVLLALQCVGPNVDRFMRLQDAFPAVRFSTIVDDIGHARLMSLAASGRETKVNLFMDLDVGMHRTGVLPDDRAVELYEFMTSSLTINALGFHAYDGHIHDADESLARAQMEKAFESVWNLKSRLEAVGCRVDSVVGCGTPTSSLMLKHFPGQKVEVSAGTSVLWDAGQPTMNPPLQIQSAAVLLSRVISRPTRDTICLDLGHKAVASEMQPPRVVFAGLEDATTLMHNEEHLVLRTPNAERYEVGSLLYGVPTHICPTVALYNEVWPVIDQRAGRPWPVVGRSRRITI